MAACYALVHSPLVGPGCWTGLAHALHARGSRAIVPDLTDAMSGAPPYYAKLATLACDAIAHVDDVAVVAHSGAGALVPSIVQRQTNVAAAIFLDALLPHPGQSWLDTAPADLASHLRGLAHEGFLPPWHLWWPPEMLSVMLPDEGTRAAFTSELKELPLAYFEECAPEAVMPARIRCIYIRLSEAYEAEACRAEALGWRVVREPLYHLAILTRANEVADVIVAASTKE